MLKPYYVQYALSRKEGGDLYAQVGRCRNTSSASFVRKEGIAKQEFLKGFILSKGGTKNE